MNNEWTSFVWRCFFSPNLGWKSSLKLGTKYLDTLNTCQSLGAPVTADLVLACLAFQLKNSRNDVMWMTREVLNSFQKKWIPSGWYRKVQVPYMVSKVPFLWFPAGYTPVHIATKIWKLDKLCFKTDLSVEVFVVDFGYIQFLKLQGQKRYGHRVHWKNRSMEWWGFPKLSFSRAWKSGSIWYLASEDPQSVLFFLLPGKKRKR